MKKTARIIAIALLLVTGFLGITNGFRELDDGLTALQQSVTFAVLVYGVLGFLGAVGLIRRRPWAVTVTIAWTLAAMWAASVASFAFHDPTLKEAGTLSGVAGAFVGTALIGSFVIWVAHRETRQQALPNSTHAPGAVS